MPTVTLCSNVTLIGNVVSKDNYRDPIINAQVFLLDISVSTTTDGDGNFYFDLPEKYKGSRMSLRIEHSLHYAIQKTVGISSAVISIEMERKITNNKTPVVLKDAIPSEEDNLDLLSYLNKQLKSEDPRERSNSARELSKMKNAAAASVPNLITALIRDTNEMVKIDCLHALKSIGTVDNKVENVLVICLKAKNYAVRKAAISTIESLKVFSAHTDQNLKIVLLDDSLDLCLMALKTLFKRQAVVDSITASKLLMSGIYSDKFQIRDITYDALKIAPCLYENVRKLLVTECRVSSESDWRSKDAAKFVYSLFLKDRNVLFSWIRNPMFDRSSFLKCDCYEEYELPAIILSLLNPANRFEKSEVILKNKIEWLTDLLFENNYANDTAILNLLVSEFETKHMACLITAILKISPHIGLSLSQKAFANRNFYDFNYFGEFTYSNVEISFILWALRVIDLKNHSEIYHELMKTAFDSLSQNKDEDMYGIRTSALQLLILNFPKDSALISNIEYSQTFTLCAKLKVISYSTGGRGPVVDALWRAMDKGRNKNTFECNPFDTRQLLWVKVQLDTNYIYSLFRDFDSLSFEMKSVCLASIPESTCNADSAFQAIKRSLRFNNQNLDEYAKQGMLSLKGRDLLYKQHLKYFYSHVSNIFMKRVIKEEFDRVSATAD